MIDFKIKRGLSTALFTASGAINPKLLIEEGCWYLCTDTAELFLGTALDDGTKTLKQINTEKFSLIQELAEELDQRLTTIESQELFVQIDSITELPTDFTSTEFNPNVTYYLVTDDETVTTFVFNKHSQTFLRTTGVDTEFINQTVSEAIVLQLEDRFTELLPKAIVQTLTGTILYGGNANNS